MVREKKNEYKFNTNQAMKKENKETLKQQKKNKRNRSEKWLKKNQPQIQESYRQQVCVTKTLMSARKNPS